MMSEVRKSPHTRIARKGGSIWRLKSYGNSPAVGFAVVVHANGIWIRPGFPVTNALQLDDVRAVLIAVREQSEPVQTLVRGQSMVASRRAELRVTVAHGSAARYVIADGRPEMGMRETVHYGVVHHGRLKFPIKFHRHNNNTILYRGYTVHSAACRDFD